MKILNKLLSDRVVGVSSGGGHLKELLDAIPSYNSLKQHYITFRNGHTENFLKNKEHSFIIDPHVSKFKYLINFFQSLVLYLKLRPKVIVSTGAGIAIPFLLLGFFFGSKIIFIESGARISNPSKTGQFLYRYSDLFIVQYAPLQKIYPKSILASL